MVDEKIIAVQFEYKFYNPLLHLYEGGRQHNSKGEEEGSRSTTIF